MSGNFSPLHTTSFGEPDSPWCGFQVASGPVPRTFAQDAVDMMLLHAVPAAMVIRGSHIAAGIGKSRKSFWTNSALIRAPSQKPCIARCLCGLAQGVV